MSYRNNPTESFSPYDSIVLRGRKASLQNVENEVLKLLTLDDTGERVLKEKNIVSIISNAEGVPGFAHPIHAGETIIIDRRPYVNREGKIKRDIGDHLLVQRAKIEHAWLMSPDIFASQDSLIVDIFSTWFSKYIANRLNLDTRSDEQLKVLAAIFYAGKLHSKEELDRDELEFWLLRRLPKMLRISADFISEVLDDREEMIWKIWLGSLPDLATTFNDIMDNSVEIDIEAIYNALSRGAFIGANNVEIVSVAIEHPPTFMILVDYALEKGLQGKTTLGRISNSLAGKHNHKKFKAFMHNIILAEG